MKDTGVTHITEADKTDKAEAPTQGDSGLAAGFTKGAHNANPTVEIKQGVWGDGFTKSG